MSTITAEMKDEEGFWTILCPREKKKIPIYRCIGSFVKATETCSSIRASTVSLDGATVKCLWPKEREEPK